MKKIIYILLSAASIAIPGAAQNNGKATVLDVKTSISDNNIVYPESFEADTRKMLEGWYMKNYAATDDRYKRLPDRDTDDKTIRERLAKLPTVIDMPFNKIVRDYIDRYTKKGREQVTVLLGLSNYYMPIFEQALEEQGLPLELKYLPVIESALDPNAVSKHGAAGLWQFMIATAHGLGLEVNSLVDERRDPYLSSQKAARYLKDLYNTYGDWSLAIAAYNCGPSAVNKAIRRAGGEPTSQDFWSIYNYLTPETRGYVPMFIAANYVMNYYPEHNISPVLVSKPLVTDTIRVSDRVHFNQISSVLNIPVDELRLLNPQFRADLIPGSQERSYTLVLPSQQIHAYLMSENEIKSFDADKYLRRTSAEPGEQAANISTIAINTFETGNDADNAPALDALPVASAPSTKGTRTINHKVRPGETLASIASQYNVKPEDIKKWNRLRRNAVRTGQQLRINTAEVEAGESLAGESVTPDEMQPETAAPARSYASSKSSRKSSSARSTNHKLRSGETLSSLAKKYGVSIDAIKKANGMKNDNLRAGNTIKIPSKSSSGSKKKSGRKKRRRR